MDAKDAKDAKDTMDAETERLMFAVGVALERAKELVGKAWDGAAPLDRDRAWALVSALRVASAAAQGLEVRARRKGRNRES